MGRRNLSSRPVRLGRATVVAALLLAVGACTAPPSLVTSPAIGVSLPDTSTWNWGLGNDGFMAQLGSVDTCTGSGGPVTVRFDLLDGFPNAYVRASIFVDGQPVWGDERYQVAGGTHTFVSTPIAGSCFRVDMLSAQYRGRPAPRFAFTVAW